MHHIQPLGGMSPASGENPPESKKLLISVFPGILFHAVIRSFYEFHTDPGMVPV